MKKKYIKYRIIETGKIYTLHENENPDLYKRAFDLYGKEKLPYINSFGEVKILEFGEKDERNIS